CRAGALSCRELEEQLATRARGEHGRSALALAERSLRAAERVARAMAKMDRPGAPCSVPPAVVERAIAVHEKMICLSERELERLRALRRRSSRPGPPAPVRSQR
ncbi:MAG: hypothetical protein ACRELB_19350, partial [Polyangiaceae bacterium]